jgi:hypothetical protein
MNANWSANAKPAARKSGNTGTSTDRQTARIGGNPSLHVNAGAESVRSIK